MKLFKKICTIILFLYCSLFVIGNIKLNAAAVVPTDYTDIFANSTIDITDNMDDILEYLDLTILAQDLLKFRWWRLVIAQFHIRAVRFR